MLRQAPARALPRGLRASGATTKVPRRTFIGQRHSNSRLDRLNINNLSRARNDYDRDRTYFLAAGALAGAIGTIFTATKLWQTIQAEDKKKEKKKRQQQNSQDEEPERGVAHMDAGSAPGPLTTEAGSKRKVVIHGEDGYEVVPTGHSTVPEFPRILELPSFTPADANADPTAPVVASTLHDAAGVEYTLVGLGLRSVSFLGINVYVVGFYVATADIATLQRHLVHKVNPIATTLVPSERETLRESLLDPKEGEATWIELLQDLRCRTAFRVVPVRDTDFHHLRDGFVRAIQARSSSDKQAYGDEAFGEAMRDFRALFARGKAPKKRELVLCRDARGAFDLLYDDGSGAGRKPVGRVEDPRVSKLLWLNYLAGSKVASEEARKNIVHGVMEFVERPVGTVATQVV